MSTRLDRIRSPGPLYAPFRWLVHTALRWYYRDVEVIDAERMPATGAAFVAVNHSQALVDALLAVDAVSRPLRITAKATLFGNPLLAVALRGLGMVPLRRASDEPNPPPANRNVAAFETLAQALGQGEAVLIFPEGISHSDPELAPLKSGLARIALATVERGLPCVAIVPLGLTFEQQDAPRSRVVAQFGAPLIVTPALAETLTPELLTAEVDQRLRAVTLNFPSREAADRVRGVAATLALTGARAGGSLTGATPSLALEITLAKRVQAAASLLQDPDAGLQTRAAEFLGRLDRWRSTVAASGIAAQDLWIDLSARSATRFVVREGLIALAEGPLALWGVLNHWIPLRLARWVGLRTTRHADEPAMRTIAVGFWLVVAFYLIQTAVVGTLAGPWWALAYLVTLPLSATEDFHFRDRGRRVLERARTYLALRRRPALRAALRTEALWLWDEALTLERGVDDR